jgi:hypothetical protein
MEKTIQKGDDFLSFYGHTPLWDSYYQTSQNKKFKNKWDKVKDGWRPRKRNTD